jgi:hypothetical protein
MLNGAKEAGSITWSDMMITTSNSDWESTLKELTRLAEKFPSKQIYQQLAECYRRIDEQYEARVMLAMSDDSPDATQDHVVL